MNQAEAALALPDRYEVIRTLGRGGMGVVVLALDRSLGRQVAIKIARAVHDDDDRRKRRFLAEARATAQLEHPAIVPIYDLVETLDGRLAFSMRYVEGRSLAEALRDARDRPVTSLLLDVIRICDGVAYAHARGVLHRDLKPSNVMLGRFGEVLVMDWGLVGKTGEPDDHVDPITLAPTPRDSALTEPGTIVGSPGYVAPEVVRGAAASVASDVFSLGAIVYEVLTLQRAVPGSVPAAILANTVVQAIVPPRVRTPERGIPEALDAIAMRALAPDPADRFPDVASLRDALAAELAPHQA